VAALPASDAEEDLSPAEIEKKLKAEPQNPQWMAMSAREWLDRKDYAQARRMADGALKLDPKNQLAAYVRARLYLLLGETKPAVALLTGALDEAKPQPNLLGLLAGLRLKAEDYPEAARLYQVGSQADPADPKWAKALASVYLKSNEHEKLAIVLAQLVAQDADEFAMRKKLAQLAIEKEDFAAAQRWAQQALQINVMDADVHRMLAQALKANGKPEEAQQEETTANELEGGSP
jgi:predicted Zn-dependent protease